MKKILAGAVIVLFLFSNALAEESIFVGGASLKLGDKKADVINQIEKHYILSEDGSMKNMFSIKDKRSDEYIGYVQFEKNTLSAVHKKWGNYPIKEGEGIVKALIGAISTIPENQRFAHVSTHRMFTPDLTMETIMLSFGHREIHVQMNQGKINTIIQIDEYLR